MHRFYDSSPDVAAGRLRLSKPEAHHAVAVLRVREGDHVRVLDGRGGELICRVESKGRREVSLQVLEEVRHSKPHGELVLIQSIVKGKAMELIVQKATELGASRIIPLITERTVARPDPSEFESKAEKWRGVAVEALKQCGAPWLPLIDQPRELGNLLEGGLEWDLSLVAALDDERCEARDRIESYVKEDNPFPRTVSIWIGPEGDFTPMELEEIQSAGVAPFGLGPLTLRSETASMAALAIVGAELRHLANA